MLPEVLVEVGVRLLALPVLALVLAARGLAPVLTLNLTQTGALAVVPRLVGVVALVERLTLGEVVLPAVLHLDSQTRRISLGCHHPC